MSPIPIDDIENLEETPNFTGFALFAYGFRPFFLGAGLFGVFSIALWLGVFFGTVDLNFTLPPSVWHAHEMLFGYTAAAVAGFLLTVVPNWTRAPARKGPILMLLTALWLLGRMAMLAQGMVPYALIAAVDLSFLAVFSALVAGPLFNSPNRRQMMFVLILISLFMANVMIHLSVLSPGLWGQDWAERGVMLGIDGVVVLLAIMGGRVIPSFTSSYLGHQNPDVKVIQNPKLEKIVIALTWGMLIMDQISPESMISGGLLCVAAVAHFWRLKGWQGWRTLKSPIVWVLHVGYLWFVVGFALRGLAVFGLFDGVASLHAVTIGGVGMISLGIMTRASLGHTGRQIKAHKLTVGAYVFVSLAALSRILVEVFPALGEELVIISGMFWVVGFAMFVVVYAPILWNARVDGRAG